MSGPKPIASLNASLLARKGDARPAIRRAYIPIAAVSRIAVAAHDDRHDPAWNDMDLEPSQAVRTQQHRIASSFTAEKKPLSLTSKNKVAFTLRLDTDRHLRLRLASAVNKRSAQQIVTEALDAFLNNQPGLDALVDQVRKSRTE